LIRAVYTAFLHVMLPWLPLRLWWRGRREPLYRHRIAERFGIYQGPKSERKIVWLHAVSLGEMRAAQPLVRALRERHTDYDLLITCMTATGRAAAQSLYPDARCVWLPYDYPWAVNAFLRRFQPSLGIFMETELWPNLLRACKRSAVPTLLANARLSDRSANRYQLVGGFARAMFESLDAVGAQSEADARRLRQLGARNIRVTGNLKFDVALAEAQIQAGGAWRAAMGSRPVFLAASTREGEERLLLDAWTRRLGSISAESSETRDHPLLVIVPRHPQRFDEIADLLSSRDLAFARRSLGELPDAQTAVYLGDTMGEMPFYYAASDLAFIGGSLLPFGAQNLIEACAVGAPVLIGPSTFNFAEAAALALRAGAARQVRDADQLANVGFALLKDGPALVAMARAARTFASAHRGATEATLALIEPLLKR